MKRIWLFLSLLSLSARAESYTFGVEQELRHALNLFSVAPLFDGIAGRPVKELEFLSIMAGKSYLDLLRREALRRPGEIEIQGDRVYYPKQDWGFRVTAEYNTVEFIFEPITLEKAKALEGTLQHDLWDLGARRQLTPWKNFSAGHVHIGLSAFGGETVRLLNYYVDFANHPELYNGIFANDPLNSAPPLQDAAGREAFRQLLADFDAGRIANVEELRVRLAEIRGFGKPRGNIQGALNAKTKHPTIEFRAVRTHRSAAHLVAFLELQARRLDYLKTQTGRIAWRDPGIPEDPRQQVAQFHQYATEAGMDWNRAKMLMPDDYARIRPDEKWAWRASRKTEATWRQCVRAVLGL